VFWDERSVGLITAANEAIATGPGIWVTPQSFVLNLFFIIRKGRY